MVKPAPIPKPAPAPKPVVRETITLGAHALFDHDKSNLRPEGKSELDALAAKLRTFSSVQSINVVGHTDSDGTEAYNQGLSERRAASVKDYLIQQGVSGSVISTSGKGESAPAASNATRDGRQQNRRVEISITATK
jgi:OOP family OmpA-OmpF porin